MTGSDVCCLATDLDGTFLAGQSEQRNQLAAHFSGPDRQLVYVTGRSLSSVMGLIEDGALPAPDHIICDVGTTVAAGDGRPETADFATNIARQWAAVAEPLRAQLAPITGLRQQPDANVGPNRAGFYFGVDTDIDAAVAIVEAHDADVIMSDGTFFDVLPRGVNKGSTLLAACAAWGIDSDAVVVAGDTLNDLAMLTAGPRAVVVGNAEPALLQALPESPNIYRAEATGCGGVLEGLAAFGVVVPS